MKTDELRRAFLDFFEKRGHTVVPSDSLVPTADPTLLFTGSGMNQFKRQFLGEVTDFARATTCQKCLRTDDLPKVGKTVGHHTFFEMLGNFSFGDYFKNEAISWAWEFVTQRVRLDRQRLWVSVYEEDDEAYRIWKDTVGLPASRIVKCGAKDNFWPSDALEEGPNGPCGPCSELFYDQGAKFGCGRAGCKVGCDCGRWVEIWNLVFTQFERKDAATGKGGILLPLPNKNIDTGMGLERMAAVLQGTKSNFEIDIFEPIVGAIKKEAQSAKRRAQREKPNAPNLQPSSIYAIADHIRAITFAISDGVLPSNEQRGYVVRKLIRKASWYGQSLGIKKPFLYKVVSAVVEVMADPYPELGSQSENVSHITHVEEERFLDTLHEGGQILKDIITTLKAARQKILPGEQAFRLYDTYGFPLELTQEIVQGENLTVDLHGFEHQMNLQRQRAQLGTAISSSIFAKKQGISMVATKFIGYENSSCEATISGILKGESSLERAKRGDEVHIILDQTPFYGEAGGQVGDTGAIVKCQEKQEKEQGRHTIDIYDTKRTDETIVHLGRVIQGVFERGDKVIASIDKERRIAIARNHTATHLLQFALRSMLGSHLQQSGSFVDEERLRFDFIHFEPISSEQLDKVEEMVNERIRENSKVDIAIVSLDEAKQSGALAFFGEKYAEWVRTVSIGNYSKELCGGTHVDFTGQLGLFRIVSESSIGAGTRRIEALTGHRAYEAMREERRKLWEVSQILKTPRERIVQTVEETSEQLKRLKKDLDKSRLAQLKYQADTIISQATEIDGIKVIAAEIGEADMELLRSAVDLIKRKISSAVITLGARSGSSVSFVTSVPLELTKKGLHAGKIVKAVAEITKGGGGGRADLAQAGGKDLSRFNEALGQLPKIIKKELKNIAARRPRAKRKRNHQSNIGTADEESKNVAKGRKAKNDALNRVVEMVKKEPKNISNKPKLKKREEKIRATSCSEIGKGDEKSGGQPKGKVIR